MNPSTNNPGLHAAEGKVDGTYKASKQQYLDMKDADLCALNDVWYRRVIKTRFHVEKEAVLGMAFFTGQQHLELVSTGDTELGMMLVTPRTKKGRSRTVVNQIRPICRNELARLMRNRPMGTVVPDGDDDADSLAATHGDRVISHVWSAHDVESFLEDAVMWAIVGCSSLVNVSWDDTRRSRFGEMGDYVFRALSIFEWGIPYLRCPRLEDQPYLMVTKTYTVQEIYERWGIEVEPESEGSVDYLQERLKQTLVQANSSYVAGFTQEEDLPSAVVKETWVKPCRQAPDGMLLITAGGKVLEKDVWPDWANGVYPFRQIDFTSVPGSAYGQSLVIDLIPMQRRLNRLTELRLDALAVMSKQSVGIPQGTQINRALGGMGVVYETPRNATTGVSQVQGPMLGTLPNEEEAAIMSALSDVSHQHQVTRGQNPPGVRAGTQVEVLKELDDGASIIPQRAMERAVEMIGNLILTIAKSRWSEPRRIIVGGRDSDIERAAFYSADDLGGAGQFMVQSGSAWPQTKAERQNLILQMLPMADAQGNPLITADQALRSMEMGGLAQLQAERFPDKRHAQRENQAFDSLQIGRMGGQIQLSAQIPQPLRWHNHVEHLAMHDRLRKSAIYATWPDWKKQIFDAHCDAHEMALRAPLASAAAEMAVADGLGMPETGMMPGEVNNGQPDGGPDGSGGNAAGSNSPQDGQSPMGGGSGAGAAEAGTQPPQ